MQVYSETKDPNETKDYGFDWTPQLATGETVVSQVVVWVDRAGTTSPADSVTANVSKVYVAGGNAGSRAIWSVRATTSSGNVLEESFGLDIVDSTTLTTASVRIDLDLKASYALRSQILAGGAITDLWRDGRRVRKTVPTLAELNSHILYLERELAAALANAAGLPRRRAITLGFRN